MRDECAKIERELAARTAERDQLRAEVERFKGWLSEPQALHAHCLRTLNEAQIAHLFGERMTEIVNRAEKAEAQLHALRLVCGTTDANKFETWTDRANARAERAEAAETVALAKWNGALERAMKAEADLAALEQCHDANCRGVVKIAAELDTEREKAERYRLVTLKQDAELAAAKERLRSEAMDDYASIKDLQRELATERARLDWVFRNCKVMADDYTTGHRDVYAIHDREDLGAAMKEDAK
jgi:hypothetical protein